MPRWGRTDGFYSLHRSAESRDSKAPGEMLRLEQRTEQRRVDSSSGDSGLEKATLLREEMDQVRKKLEEFKGHTV